jgi:hypothetical protein
MYCRPTWRRFIDTLVLVGKIPDANYGVQWTAPKSNCSVLEINNIQALS